MPLRDMQFEDGQEPHPDYFVRRVAPSTNSNEIRVKFFGCNSLWISDGSTHLLIDPYFTRPFIGPPAGLYPRWMDPHYDSIPIIEPNEDIIGEVLRSAGIIGADRNNNLVDAIIVTHTHYDHALDVPAVWATAGGNARIFGTPSLGYILDAYDERIRNEGHYIDFTELPGRNENVDFAERLCTPRHEVGSFQLTFLRGHHSWPRFIAALLSADISGEIGPEFLEHWRAHEIIANDYKEGGAYNVLIEHERGRLLIQGVTWVRDMPGYYRSIFRGSLDPPASPRRLPPDVMIVQVGGFNSWSVHSGRRERRTFIDEVIQPTKPDTILFTHWEDPDIRLDRPMCWWWSSYETYGLFRSLIARNRYCVVARNTAGPQTLEPYDPVIGFLPVYNTAEDEIYILPTREIGGRIRS